MASFTDKIPQFNPYVQQLPVDAMVQVGMQKQKQYDEGIQKIQTNIDNVAGLEVANDVDKVYLQSKLNQLGNDLKTVAAGDFSNFQLVNSVNGMTNQIVKDSNVQNAVTSTARLKKEQARKEKAIQEGKSSPENEYAFNNQVGAYLQSTKPGESFNGQYIEYKDVDKKLRGLVADLQKAGFEQTIEDPWVRDSLGRDIYFNPDKTQSLDASKGGTRKYDMVKLTTKIKGVGAEKILNNFYDSLDEGDKRQLNITAQYHYKDATPITFQNDIIKTYNEKKRIYSDAIVDATVKLAIGNYTSEEKITLENQINKAKELLYDGGFDKQMNEDLAGVDTEAEADSYKYKIYTQKYLTNLSKDLANESKSIEYSSNAGFQAFMDKKKFEFDVAKERQREREWQADFGLKIKEDLRQDEESARKRKEDVTLQPIVKTQKISTEVPSYGINDLDADIEKVDSSLIETTNKLASLLLPNAKTPQEKKNAAVAANKLYEEYRLNPFPIKDNTQRELLQQMDELDDVKNKLVTKLDYANKAGAGFDKKTRDIINKQNGVRVGSTSFSAKELFDFKLASSKFTITEIPRAKEAQPITKMSSDILKQYRGTKNYPLALALYNSTNGIGLSSNERVIVNQVNQINSNVSREVYNLANQQRLAQNKAINDVSPEFQQMNIQINTDNKRDMNVIDQIIGLKTKDYNEFGALNSSRPNDFTPAKMEQLRKEGKLGYTYIKNNDGSATLVVTSGENVQKIPLTSEEFRNWATDYSYVNPMSDVIYTVQANKNKTTNRNSTTEGSTARYSGLSPLLPGLNNTKIATKIRMDIEGSPNNIGNADTDMFQARFYYYDGKKWKVPQVLNSGGYLDASNLQIILSQTGQKTIETLFK